MGMRVQCRPRPGLQDDETQLSNINCALSGTRSMIVVFGVDSSCITPAHDKCFSCCSCITAGQVFC